MHHAISRLSGIGHARRGCAHRCFPQDPRKRVVLNDLSVYLRFEDPCSGNVDRRCAQPGGRKHRHRFAFPVCVRLLNQSSVSGVL